MSDLTHDALVEAMAQAMSKPLSNMYGGCFKPEGRDQRADCADGDCYCARVGKHCARAALAAIREAAAGVSALNAGALILLDGAQNDNDRIVAEHLAALLRALAGGDDGR